MFEWRSNNINDKILIAEARRVLDHEYIASIPSASREYYGFLIKQLQIMKNKVEFLKIVIYKVGKIHPHQIIWVYTSSYQGFSKKRYGVASISRSNHLYLSNHLSKNTFIPLFFNIFIDKNMTDHTWKSKNEFERLSLYLDSIGKTQVLKINESIGVNSKFVIKNKGIFLKFRTRTPKSQYKILYTLHNNTLNGTDGFGYTGFSKKLIINDDSDDSNKKK